MPPSGFDEYYNQHRTVGEPDHSFIRATANVSKVALERSQKTYAQAVSAKYDERQRLFAEYQAAILQGEIAEPSRIERLLKIAQGHEDLEAVQAARRILQKQEIDWKK